MTDDRKMLRSRGRPRKSDMPAAGGRVQSIDRALTVFKLLSEEVKATLNVVSVTVNLPPSTTHRILETLRAHGMVSFDESDQTWSVGVEAFRIGQGYARRMNFLDVSREVMRDLTDSTGETSNIAVLEDWVLTHVSEIETKAPIRAFIPAGSRSHPHASGIGKALLACMNGEAIAERLGRVRLPRYTHKTIVDVERLLDDLGKTRTRGWAFDDEERFVGMRCIAAPIFDEYGGATAGISISGPTTRLTGERVDDLARHVVASAARITRESGGRPPGAD